MSNFLSTADLDVDSLKTSYINYLKTQDRFKDINFEGSNISALIDILIQNTYYGNYYLNMVGAESFLDSAALRNSVVSRAKELNYTPRSRVSSRAIVSVEIVPDDSPNTITIPKGYIFKSTINNTQYNFITDQAHVITNNSGSYELTGIDIFEGRSVTEFFTAAVTENDNGYTEYTSRFILQSENLDKASIEVYVTSNSVRRQYTQADNLFNLSPTNNIFFIQAYKENQYEIVFGDGVLGNALTSGDTVEVVYRDTLGSGANGINAFTFSSQIDGYSNITVTTTTRSYGGAERESITSIKYNAPRHFTNQERAVIEEDYKNILTENFPEIEAVNAYGGEDSGLYGKIIIALKLYGSTVISDILKKRIQKFLLTKSATREAIVNALDYYYVKIDSSVRYNADQTSLTESQVKSNIINKILELNTITNYQFNQTVYGSTITDKIQGADTSIISNSTSLKIIKRISPIVNTSNLYEINFYNELETDGVLYEFPLDHEPIVESSTFTYLNGTISITAWIQDNGNGNLGIYTFDTDGNKVMVTNIGTVNYTTGYLNFTTTIQGYTGNYISIYAKPQVREIILQNNGFALIDSNDITLNMVETNA